MLNQGKVLKYIKDNLAFPFNFIEKTDEEILEYVKDYTLTEFSHYVPQVKKIPLNLSLPSNKVPTRGNEYYIEDPEGIEILNVVNVYFPISNWVMFGHPPMGAFDQMALRNWALDVEVAGMIKQFSSYDYTHEFIHPNIIRISPTPNAEVGSITIEYERKQPEDLSGIPFDFQMFFCEMALADIMVMIGRIRKRYGDGQLRTPYGEVPLGTDILEEGKQKKTDVIDKLIAGTFPNIILDIG